jgi:hypothetical protein
MVLGVFIGRLSFWQASASHQNSHHSSERPADYVGPFAPDPQDISNRLYRQVQVRTAKNGKEYGFDELDPLLWSQTKFLLIGPSHEQLLRLLDEFSRAPADQQPHDPVKNAILARELWAVFDWAAEPSPSAREYSSKQERGRRELTSRLAQVIHRLALTQTEIATLPDNYQRAIQKKEFFTEYDPQHPERPFLPPDLFDPRGPWVCVGLTGADRIAPSHELIFSRSVFLVFMHLSEGREAALEYLRRLVEPQSSQKLPAGAEFALVRQMILPDVEGNLVLTPVTESVQIRHYRETASDTPPDNQHFSEFVRRFQSVFELKLDRAALFTGEQSGLHAVNSKEQGFLLFMSHGFDPFEDLEPLEKYPPVLSFCASCHSGLGIQSLLSFTQRWNPVAAQPLKLGLSETTPTAEEAKVIAWKQTQDNWKLLLRLWNAGSARWAK